MASFGAKKKDKNVDRATQNAVAAVRPVSYEDPFGTFKNGKFTPNESQDQINARITQDSRINQLTGMIDPDSFSVEELYDNPFYEHMSRMYKRVIDQQRERDTRELDDNLNARNQMGSSYEALMRRYMNQDYATRFDQADDQARMASAQAWQQQYQNMLMGLESLSNERSKAQERMYAPAKMALGYQSAVSPLQTAAAGAYMNQANYFAQRPTMTDRLFQSWGLANGTISALMGGSKSQVPAP